MAAPTRPRPAPRLLDRSLADVIGALASPHELAGGGGPAAALTAAAAAALTAKAARASRAGWIDAGGAIGRAEALRAQVQALVDLDADAYQRAFSVLMRTEPSSSAYGGPTGPGAEPLASGSRERVLDETLRHAADVPLAIAEAASEIAQVAAEVAAAGSRATRPDALTAVALAEAAASSAALLVDINRRLGPGDERRQRAAEAAQGAVDARAWASRLTR
jgi:formiminotetrahydrofolate cyclodeaminase